MLHGIDPVFAVSGLAVGLLVGITGVGGGSLMTPLLVLAFGVHPATAVGTDLLYAGLTKITGGAVHAYHGSVDWRITRRLAYGSVPASALSLLLLARLGSSSQASGGIISTTLGIALIMTALTLIFRKALLARLTRLMDGASEQTIRVLTIVLGAILGVLVTISSVGAGAIGATILLTLYPKSPIVRIVGSDIAHAVPLTLIAGAGHWWLGSVDPHMRLTAGGLHPGHYHFQPFRLSRPRPGAAPHLGRHACGRRWTPRVLIGRDFPKPTFGLFLHVPSHCPRGQMNASGEDDA
jgi:uncharacterized protein